MLLSILDIRDIPFVYDKFLLILRLTRNPLLLYAFFAFPLILLGLCRIKIYILFVSL